jgi:hypothetical protein
MSRTCRIHFTLSFLWTVSLTGFAQTASANGVDPTLKITVCVYNHAHVPSSTLAQAKKEASRIYRQAGVEVAWLDRPLSAEQAQGQTNYLEQLGHTGFVMKILPRSMAVHLQIRDAALGYAPPCREGESGCIAHVLYHKVEDLAKGGNASLSQILGLAIAHELGHLLLRSNAHFPSGIMQAQWRAKDLQRASKGLLLFTPEQAQTIRAEVFRRVRQHEACQAARHETPKYVL